MSLSRLALLEMDEPKQTRVGLRWSVWDAVIFLSGVAVGFFVAGFLLPV